MKSRIPALGVHGNLVGGLLIHTFNNVDFASMRPVWTLW